jgi:hypothetical protein
MINSSQPQPSDHAELPVSQADSQFPPVEVAHDQAVLEDLLSSGFAWDEAVQLLRFRDHLYSNQEMRQRVANDHRMQFVRWLYEQGELDEIISS